MAASAARRRKAAISTSLSAARGMTGMAYNVKFTL
jgi:hypothetical protein